MKHWMNIGHVQFDLFMFGVNQYVIGKMLHCDESGISILVEMNGEIHSYALGVIQHACLAS